MVQIMVRMADNPDEWGLVELQGKLETKDEQDLDGLDIGDLHFDERGTPLLVIGHHLLSGKIVKLERPYAIMTKTSRDGGRDDESEEMPMEGSEDLDSNAGSENAARKTTNTEYVISAVIRRKIIFKIRPKPIVRKRIKK